MPKNDTAETVSGKVYKVAFDEDALARLSHAEAKNTVNAKLNELRVAILADLGLEV